MKINLTLVGNWSETSHFGPFIIDIELPVIKEVKVEGKPCEVGDKLSITIVGEPHGTAKFSLGDVAQDVPMKEAPDGEVGSSTETFLKSRGVTV